MFSKFTLALTLPLLISSAFAGDCVRRYTVAEGDTCDSISASENVSTYQLAVINAGYIDQQCSNLKPGDNICLGYDGEDCTTTYVVKAKDTCDAITQAHSVDITTLLANNPQINDNCDNIYIGEVLCVAPEIRVPPAPVGASNVVPTAIPVSATPANPPPSGSTGASNLGGSSGGDNNSNDDDDDSLPFCDEL
ncbi:hypothetical protein E1B28_005885 [Marasmius oreades]|uniref:LysM domain-containing protein n=1 Tax=Marasmius oreades TaxID=181124 RepID=A0A9P7S6B8_9AGAR|nr:uncharacterized protein E1B28_005885 [Marasmius oreades]KAG7095098.1 hypothetical protein E1B28_005885 [Marasmius oreades]